MSTLYGYINGVMTLLLMLVFIGIVAWAWSRRRKADFDSAARLPLEEDVPAARERAP